MVTELKATLFAAIVLLADVVTGTAIAAEKGPLSAIEWLSDSVAFPDLPSKAEPGGPVVSVPAAISVAPLDAPVPDRAGLVSARSLRIKPDLWGRSASRDLAEALAALPDARLAPHSLRTFLHGLMIARLDPPIDASEDDSLYLARLDRLLEIGHLDAARRLIDAAGAPEPRRFLRAFDIALLSGTETDACRVIEQTPDLSPTYPARIFCLARGGQWDVAAVTLGNAEALGILTQEEDQLLLHFLDPELFEDQALPPPPRLPTPLVFRLYEAVGERLPTDQLPLAFANADLTDTVGWQTRLRAVERLTAANAIPFERLLSVYSERSPAASGGIWDRVDAIQALLGAVESGSTKDLSMALPEAWIVAGEAHFEAALAHWLAPKLADQELDGHAGHVAFEIALIAGKPKLAEKFAAATAEDRFLLAVARGETAVANESDLLGRAILRGLGMTAPSQGHQTLIDEQRSGEALLSALADLMDGAGGNPDRTAHALALLRFMGLVDLARQTAVELLLKEGAA